MKKGIKSKVVIINVSLTHSGLMKLNKAVPIFAEMQ
jgi:hypothetical protein